MRSTTFYRAMRSLWVAVVISALQSFVLAEETYTLEESPANAMVFQVSAELDVRGTLKTAADKDKILDLELAVNANFDYRERRLPGAGRDAAKLRSLREYNRAQAAITVNKNRSFSSLAKTDPLIVAHGRREGILFYHPDAPMMRSELELLQMPGDSLAVLGFLPQTKVALGAKWAVENWAVQMLTGTEALLKSNVSCELESIKNDLARVRFDGTVEGAIQGATTVINLTGHYTFDMKRNYLRSVDLKQTEKRGVGPVSPGMDVLASVKLSRSPAIGNGKLTEAIAEKIPLEPEADQLELLLPLPWNATITHSRDWHIFQRTANQTVLRLVDGGSLIAQCNISRFAEETGERMSEPQFRELVKKGLGESLKSITGYETLAEGPDLTIDRLTAQGESQKIEMTWRYYQAATPAGRILFFVAFETDLKEKLGEADLNLVKSLKMKKPELIPAGGEK